MLSGVRVADVLFTGCCDTSIGMLDFIAQEFIVTETVEAGHDDERVPQDILHVVVCRYSNVKKCNDLELRGSCTQDEVNAPSKEWHRIEEEVNAKLRALPILPEDAPPVLPGRKELCPINFLFFFTTFRTFAQHDFTRFTIESLTHFLTVWKDLVPRALRSIAEAGHEGILP